MNRPPEPFTITKKKLLQHLPLLLLPKKHLLLLQILKLNFLIQNQQASTLSSDSWSIQKEQGERSQFCGTLQQGRS